MDKRPATLKEPAVVVPSGIVVIGIAGPNEIPPNASAAAGASSNTILLVEIV